jgi:hypothetical protein
MTIVSPFSPSQSIGWTRASIYRNACMRPTLIASKSSESGQPSHPAMNLQAPDRCDRERRFVRPMQSRVKRKARQAKFSRIFGAPGRSPTLSATPALPAAPRRSRRSRPNRGLHDRFVREWFPCAKRISVGGRIDRARHNGLCCRMPKWRSQRFQNRND